jgi:PAP_fibrillin
LRYGLVFASTSIGSIGLHEAAAHQAFLDHHSDKPMTQATLSQKILGWFSLPRRNVEDQRTQVTQLKQALLDQLEQFQRRSKNALEAPLTNLDLTPQERDSINAAIAALEAVTPYPEPLRKGIKLLNANWLLRYSDAREITTLSARPRLGLQLEKVYQTINVDDLSFENRAFVKHRWGLISGAVAITARFEPAAQPRALRTRRINVFFEERSLCICTLLGLRTPFLDPFKVIPATPPEDRIPCLDITYLDKDLRIGRGGEGSLFVLTKL